MGAYRELAPAREVHPLIACRWVRDVPENEQRHSTLVLPDGCVDLLWRDERLLVAGPDRAAQSSPIQAGLAIVGIRLRPGVAGVVLGMPASELLDARVPLEEVLGSRAAELSERLGQARGHEEAFQLLEGLIASLADDAGPDPLVLAATRRLGFPGSRIDELAAALGISERQLRRRFHRDVGYGPKTLDRVLRFRRLVSRARAVCAGEEDLARLAAELGYADQAHMTRETLSLSGLTPPRLATIWAG